MWILISLFSALLIVSEAVKIEDFYGDWFEAGFYPIDIYEPYCTGFTFSKPSKEEESLCSCADGSNNSFYMSMRSENNTIMYRNLVPVMIVDTPADVAPALNVMCKCGDKVFGDHPVARLVNKDYFFLYHSLYLKYSSPDIEQNGAYLFSRNIVSENTLANVMISVEDLKKRHGGFLCTTEFTSKQKTRS